MATKMTATEITERINKAQETVRKLNELIWKREAKLKKMNKELAKASDKVEAGQNLVSARILSHDSVMI